MSVLVLEMIKLMSRSCEIKYNYKRKYNLFVVFMTMAAFSKSSDLKIEY